MAKQKTEELPLSVRASMYKVISEEKTETGRVVTLRTYSGATAICHIPDHTPEEEKAIAEQACRAMMQVAYSGVDLSNVKKMKIIV